MIVTQVFECGNVVLVKVRYKPKRVRELVRIVEPIKESNNDIKKAEEKLAKAQEERVKLHDEYEKNLLFDDL